MQKNLQRIPGIVVNLEMAAAKFCLCKIPLP